VLPPPQPLGTQPDLADFLKGARSLPMPAFRVAIRATIGIGRSTVRFATTRELSRLAVCGVARVEARPRLFYVCGLRMIFPENR